MKVASLVFALTIVTGAVAAEPALSVEGKVATPLHLGAADLKAFPAQTVDWAYTTAMHGDKKGTYKGAVLWDVLGKAAIKDETAKAHLRHVIVVTGRDGYAVALAIAEIDPTYEGKTVLLAYEKDGKPMDGMSLVVPGDKEGGRSVHDIASITVE